MSALAADRKSNRRQSQPYTYAVLAASHSSRVIERIPTYAPVSDMQFVVALMYAAAPPMDMHAIGRELGIARVTVKYHLRQLALKVPGDLPPAERVRAWIRGATESVLYGDRVLVEMNARTQAIEAKNRETSQR